MLYAAKTCVSVSIKKTPCLPDGRFAIALSDGHFTSNVIPDLIRNLFESLVLLIEMCHNVVTAAGAVKTYE